MNYLNQRDDIDWAINIDVDELIYINTTASLADFLRNLPRLTDQAQIRPLENIFVSDTDMVLFSASYSKVPRLAIID